MIDCIFSCLNIFRCLPWLTCHMHRVKVRHYPIFYIWKWRCIEVESFTQGSSKEESYCIRAKNHLLQETVLNGVSNGGSGQCCKWWALSCVSFLFPSQLLLTISVGTFWYGVAFSRLCSTPFNSELLADRGSNPNLASCFMGCTLEKVVWSLESSSP